MRLQTAIDRVSMEDAVHLAEQLNGKTDILEMGTSLVKDYGNLAIEKLREALSETSLLVDSKTIDEGAYEFTQAFRHGADIVTAMGAASVETLRACYEVAEQEKKTMMIDLLEVEEDKIEKIKDFPNAIYALHHSIDRKDQFDATASVAAFRKRFPEIKRLAIAGGIDLQQAKSLTEQGIIEIVIVGSKIAKAKDPLQAVNEFMGAVH
ncbi:orotidine 5'-phosphate decarboxylase [Enterococcus raffinosus]|jgi:3-hexulose-6-phosphate synthase|uniref:orotidine 5'-phosphate decarboxylase / HUMPS family protein n=1 Tax=Enterococcus raffinosus TaxID=71452 RepID=UPI00288E143D|nr:orotidine 5'-phosphate decarboxylase / HUMPS family protein [Enterococcus raffinosus]MDT2571872.1 orotidine 5'-phosphate decarboxylase [Enterococcus raffinosus]